MMNKYASRMQQSSRLRSNAITNHQWRALRNRVRKLTMPRMKSDPAPPDQAVAAAGKRVRSTYLLINKGVEESD
jgi:hypothetical protein